MASSGSKRTYNERYLYPDPLASTSASRTTRYRLLKKQKVQSEISHQESEADNYIDNLTPEQDDSTDLSAQRELDIGPTCFLSEEDILSDFFLDDCEGDFVPDDEEIENEKDIESEKEKDTDLAVINRSEQPVDESLFPGCPLSVSASNLLIMKYKARHNLTQEGLADLLQLLRLHSPSPNKCFSSVYMFNKQFSRLKQPLLFHYFCSECLCYLQSKEAKQCPNTACSVNLEMSGAISSFIEAPLEQQLQNILQRRGIFDIIKNRYKVRTSKEGDIYDGLVYQELVANGFLSNPNNLSLLFNTDGIPVFKSSSFSFWPLHLLINELPYRMRIAKENRLLAGLWYGQSKPDMSLFLKPLADGLTQLHNEGILIESCDNVPARCRFVLIAATCDLPARALVMNVVQYNGYYGCSHCLQKGTSIKVGERGRVHAFPYNAVDPTGPRRCDDLMREHAKDRVYGVKGPSWLATIPSFHLVRGMSFDYMHSVLLGVCRLLLRLWFNSKFHRELWYIGRNITEIDDRLCGIRPPDEIQRTPRSISCTVKFWKAHELRAWLLHYSPAVLNGVLMDDFYQHHLLLVEGIYLLLKDVVLECDIEQSSRLLKHYYYLFQALYGDRYQTASVHGLLHLPDTVQNLGPLWAHSCFPFESANGEILRLYHGSQAVEKQVVKHIAELQRLPDLAEELVSDSPEKEFYQQMCVRKYGKSAGFRKIIKEGLYALGKPHSFLLSDSVKVVCSHLQIDIPQDQLVSYPKLFIASSNRVIISRQRSTLRDNSGVLYKSEGKNRPGVLRNVLQSKDGSTYILVTPLISTGRKLCNDSVTNAQPDSHIFTCHPPRETDLHILLPHQILDKCILMDLTQHSYMFASLLPNSKELD